MTKSITKRVVSKEKPSLIRETPDDYKLAPHANGVWITIKGFSVWLRKTDEGCVVDIYSLKNEGKAMGESLASTYAFDNEASNYDKN